MRRCERHHRLNAQLAAKSAAKHAKIMSQLEADTAAAVELSKKAEAARERAEVQAAAHKVQALEAQRSLQAELQSHKAKWEAQIENKFRYTLDSAVKSTKRADELEETLRSRSEENLRLTDEVQAAKRQLQSQQQRHNKEMARAILRATEEKGQEQELLLQKVVQVLTPQLSMQEALAKLGATDSGHSSSSDDGSSSEEEDEAPPAVNSVMHRCKNSG